ncbi:ribonuclease H [Senna tora]|uniref:Ribonuclease H n=1 Tax=Senna tora TaxID=362788 RepID=A0A834X6X3_9FABA|nr:ribonuclease H [Senna tora]
MVLREFTVSNEHDIRSSVKISDFVNVQHQWDIGKLTNTLAKPAVDKILSFAPLDSSAGPDVPLWNHGEDSEFTTRSAYLCIRNLEANNSPSVWNSIWKGKIQYKHKLLMWRICHNSLPTRSKTASWSDSSAICPRCQASWESNLHVFRDCPSATRIWNSFINSKDRHIFYILPLEEWIHWNTQRKSVFSNIPWKSLFAIICSFLWDWRNRVVNEPEFVYPVEAHKVILNSAKKQMEAWNVGVIPTQIRRSIVIIPWEKPEDGWIKVNTDGSVAVNCFTNGPRVDKVCHPAVKRVWDLLSKDWVVKIKHIPRTSNTCADILAKRSLVNSSRIVILYCMPDFVKDAVLKDALSDVSLRDPGG